MTESLCHWCYAPCDELYCSAECEAFDNYPDDGSDDRNCQTCSGDGFVFGEDMGDPLWYTPGEAFRCPNCGGSGNARDQTYW